MKKVKKIINCIDKEISKYFEVYWDFHKKKYSSKKILILQTKINDKINLFNKMIDYINGIDKKEMIYKKRQIDFDAIIKYYSFLIRLYRLLIDDIIIKYICEGQCSLFAQLIDEPKENTSYNYAMVNEYLEIAQRDYYKKNQFVVISDLSTFNMKCGDLIIYSNDNGFDYKEVKIGEKNHKLCNMVLNDEIVGNLSKEELEQANRIRKQLEKHNEIDKEYGFPMLGSIKRFYDNNFSHSNFLPVVKKSMKRLKKHSYIEKQIDDCISILVVNQKTINSDAKDILKRYNPNGKNIFTYNEFMCDSLIARPYMLDWTKKEYYQLLFEEIIIYIKIDFKKIFVKMKNYIPSLNFRKANENDYKNDSNCIIDNKVVYFLKDKDEVKIGNMIFYRIASLLYTSDSSILHYVNNYEKYQKCI